MGAKEEWKPVVGYEGLYEVSNLGRIKSLPRNKTKGGIMKQFKSVGYMYVGLHKDGKATPKRVHKLVMMAFDPRPTGNYYDKNFTINHIDGDKTNNNLSNLEWCTQSENQIKAYEIGINGKTTKKVINLTTMQIFDSVTEAAIDVGSNKPSVISRVCNGVRSHYRNNRFAYLDDYENGTIPEFKGKFKKRSAETLWVTRKG